MSWNTTPGVVMDTMEVCTPPRSMSASDFSTDQLIANPSMPRCRATASHAGGDAW
jgi:hypothetical protein